MGDEEFVVKCVKPSGEDDENNPGSEVKTAYDIMLENGFNPIWVNTAECLTVKERQKNCVFIIDPFSGRAFDHLSSVGCRIFGPQCVLSCLHLKVGIPRTKVPIYSLAMKDLIISCTSLDKKTRDDVMCKVQWMGGEVSKDFTDHVTHLVAGDVGSKKYIVAGGLGKHIMSPEWVEQVWKKGKNRHLHGTDEQFHKYKCQIFKNMIVTVSGLDSESRKQVKSLVEAEGGSYSGEMKVNECTHLIIHEPKGTKYEFARKWKIQVISLKWLSDSVEKGYCQDEDQYRVERSATQRTQVSTSTPDKNKKGTGQRLSSMGDISSISHLPDLSHLNETAQTSVTRQASTDEADSLLELDLNKFNADLFLDGCRIYLSGFRGPRLEKFKKILNVGGATRYNQINDSITHVVMGEKIPNDLKALQQANFRPHVVSAAWLVESLKCGQKQDEKSYYCLELPTLQSASPKPKVTKRPTADNTIVNDRVDGNNGTTDEDREMAELMSQYTRQNKDTTLQPEEPAQVAEPVETHGDLTQDPETEAQEGGIFAGKKFMFFGFEDDQLAELAGYTEGSGGKIISGQSRQVCDYAIVPIGGYPVNVTVSEVLTNAWLQMCLEQEELLTADSNELFHPLEINEEFTPLEGCVLSISGFAGTERDCLMHIAEVLGARCQEYFVRKANNKDNKGLAASTHLITKEAEGSKYTAAKKWKLPAVSKQWLFACARSGKREAEAEYMIDNEKPESKEPVNKNTETEKRNTLPVDVPHIPEGGENSNTDCHKENKIINTVPNEKVKENTNTEKSAQIKISEDKVEICEEEPCYAEEAPQEAPHTTSLPHPETRSSDITLRDNPIPDEAYQDETLPDEPHTDVNFAQVSPPGSSQKENLGARHVTPIASRPQHGRVKELSEHGRAAVNVRTPGTAARMGIDTPSKFLNPEKTYNPNFDLNDFMSAVESPFNTNTPSSRKAGRRRKSSLPLDEALQWHMSQGMKKSTSRAENNNRQHTDLEGDFSKFSTLDQNIGPLRGVVIAVSKKLSNHQAEYNNIAAELGADYRWTYDKSCTHFIFQGRPNDINKEFRTAREHGKLVVSPHWLTMCKEQNARVDESLFPQNFNPNLTLSVVSGKRDTPGRSTRKSSRNALRSHPDDQPKTDKNTKQRIASTSDVPAKRLNMEQPKPNPLPKKVLVEKLPPSEHVHHEENEEDKLALGDMGGTLEIREAFNNEVMNIMATTKTKKTPRSRRSRRLNSSGLVDGESSSAESINKSRLSARHRQRPSPEEKLGSGQRRSRRSSKQLDQCPEPSQSVQVTWDDETGRLEQERLALELQRAHSPTQCSQAYPEGLEFGENAQFSDVDKDDSMEVQFNNNPNENKSSKKSGDFRTPTPEPPSLGFPIAQTSQKHPEPIEFIQEETNEAPEEPPPPPPVFIVSGMQQQEKDDYGALVEQLGGHMLEGQHYHSSCTHLVVGNPARNEKFLACVASGKWVLHKSYFEACRQEGRFVPEEVHEWGSDGTRSILAHSSSLSVKLAIAAHRWRIRIQDNIKANKECVGAFEGWRVVICTDKHKEENFKRLLEAGGAQVVATRPPFSSSLEATHAFLDLNKVKLSQDELEKLIQAGVNCLRPDYIASFLTEDPPPNPDESCPTEMMALKASISVPDQSLRKRKASSASDGGKKSRRL